MTVSIVWVTPNADANLAYMARVSNPKATKEDSSEKLIRYLIQHNHWSPFEMVNMCVEINTTRDIARQILRHRSFSFQEFSQRYAEVTEWAPNREARLQDYKNRQNSLQTTDESLKAWWTEAQDSLKRYVSEIYQSAIERGVAKEVARVVLPEGLTPTKMYMNGSLRSWMTYLNVRLGNGTQKEHTKIAQQVEKLFEHHLPTTYEAWRKA